MEGRTEEGKHQVRLSGAMTDACTQSRVKAYVISFPQSMNTSEPNDWSTS